MQLSPGTRLGPYEIIAPRGAGGMGEVYSARDTRLGREVAIKALPPEFSRDPDSDYDTTGDRFLFTRPPRGRDRAARNRAVARLGRAVGGEAARVEDGSAAVSDRHGSGAPVALERTAA